jgi:hypothetical protein
MSGALFASYIVLWVLVVVLILLTLLLYRQFGLMLMPGRARTSLSGLDIGAKVPAIAMSQDGGGTLILDSDQAAIGPAAVLFASSNCSICRELGKDVALSDYVGSSDGMEFMWVQSDPPPELVAANWIVALDQDGSAGRVMEVPGYPFLYVISAEERVVAKGIVNSTDEIRALVKQGLQAARSGRDV